MSVPAIKPSKPKFSMGASLLYASTTWRSNPVWVISAIPLSRKTGIARRNTKMKINNIANTPTPASALIIDSAIFSEIFRFPDFIFIIG
jgi:hypothetical protein